MKPTYEDIHFEVGRPKRRRKLVWAALVVACIVIIGSVLT